MRLRVTRYELRFHTPMETARGVFEKRVGHIVSLDRRGFGEVAPWPGFGSAREVVEAELDRLPEISLPEISLSDSILDHAAIDEVVRDVWQLWQVRTPEVLGAITSALLDDLGRRRVVPLWRLLASSSSSFVRAGVLARDAEDARRALAAGFSTFKLKVGATELERDLERVARVREVVGAANIRVDANRAWDLATAHTALGALERFGIEFVEEPLRSPSPEAFRTLRAHGVPLAVDESLTESADEWLDAHVCDVAVMKPSFLGGPLSTFELATKAQQRGLGVTVGTAFESAIGRAAAVHVAAALRLTSACGVSSPLAEDLASLGEIRAGSLAVPSGPGLGVELDRRPW
ncbi:MAG: mandelate racemase/muconate lactonizing enzyme family protein [Deltaproteobacteria bacterium]|nr:mandelate racemase/muconate lactonizing enzyme family protein [Deltaproteobacteria bacterium]